MRKLWRVVGGLAASLLLLLFLLPFLFRDRIARGVKTGVNASVNARVTWSGLGVTFFRNFPNLTVRLDDFVIAGVGPFEGDTLAAVPQLRLVLDLASVVRNRLGGAPIVVRSLDVARPVLALRVREDGLANWDIAKAREAGAPPDRDGGAVDVSLRRLTVRQGRVTLDNRPSGLDLSIAGLDETLSGDFRKTRFVLRTRTRTAETSVQFAGIPYLRRVRLDVTAAIDADLAQRTFTLRDNTVRLNDLRLAVEGSVAGIGDSMRVDLAFEAPSTEFRHILSLVPAIYARDFASIQTAGTMAVAGRVRGTYGPNAFPAFALRATVENGAFKYPDLALPARGITVDLALDNPGGSVDRTVVQLRRFHAQIGNDPIDATLVLRTPISDPDIDLRVKGRVDLAAVGRTVKLDGVDRLAGTITADALVKTRMSDLDRRRYDRVDARGTVEARGLAAALAGAGKEVHIAEVRLTFTPRAAELTTFRGTLGESDVAIAGALDNLVGFVLRGDPLAGRATLQSTRFNLNEWQSGDDTLNVIPIPANVDFTFDATMGTLRYGALDLSNVEGRLLVKDQRLTLESLQMRGLGGDIGVTGFYETVNPARPTFQTEIRFSNLEIPSAFQALTTIQRLAPVARYAQGRFSAALSLQGALGEHLTPRFETLTGEGSLATSRVVLQGFPPLDRMASVLKIPQFTDPTFQEFRSTFSIRDGRLHVQPFDVQVGDVRLNVSGSNGIDQSLLYAVRVFAPRGLLGAEADRAIAGFVGTAGKAGVVLDAGEIVALGVKLAGTVAQPTVTPDPGSLAGGVPAGVGQALQSQATQRIDSVRQQADAAAEAARLTAQAKRDSLVADAERRAEAIRIEARQVGDRIRAEGYARADSLVARAGNPVARAAAEVAAKRLRKEADTRADQVITEAEARAEAIMAAARGS